MDWNCTSGTITGAGTDSCTVTLERSGNQPGGMTISLASSNSAVTVPSSVTVPAGATSAGFTATAASVTTAQTATLTASAGGVSEMFAVQLNPPAATPVLRRRSLYARRRVVYGRRNRQLHSDDERSGNQRREDHQPREQQLRSDFAGHSNGAIWCDERWVHGYGGVSKLLRKLRP